MFADINSSTQEIKFLDKNVIAFFNVKPSRQMLVEYVDPIRLSESVSFMF